jgi:Holliday junction resolvase RusA-like endonuclease
VTPFFPLTLVLAGEPQGKGRARSFVNRSSGRIVVTTPEKTRSYEGMLRSEAANATNGAEPYEGPLEVEVVARFSMTKAIAGSKKKRAAALSGAIRPTRKPDVDNVLKLLDSMNKIVWRDDAQIVKATVTKVYAEAPALVVTVRQAWTGA